MDKQDKARITMTSFCDELYKVAKAGRLDAQANDLAYLQVGSFTLPTKQNREENPARCYWAPPDCDIRKDGTPCVMLLQGPRNPETGTLHPEKLWGGKTAVQNIDEVLKPSGWGLRLVFQGKEQLLKVYVVDLKRESEFLPGSQARAKNVPKKWVPPVEEEEDSISLDEYRARKAQQKSQNA